LAVMRGEPKRGSVKRCFGGKSDVADTPLRVRGRGGGRGRGGRERGRGGGGGRGGTERKCQKDVLAGKATSPRARGSLTRR
jgi:hypothetical protein